MTNSTCQQQIAVPSYYYPCFTAGCLWDKTKAGAGLAVINPASGPGTAVDVNYVTTTNQQRSAGVIVLGYTYTTYGDGTRSLAVVKADIDKFYSWYNVSGIFLDEGSNDCARLAYYQELVAYIKAKDPAAVVVLNWGTTGPECYLSSPNAPDIIITFENFFSNYLTYTPDAWTANYPPNRFWHLVHTTPATPQAFTRALTLSRTRRAGWVYVTDDIMANPWDTLPGGSGSNGLWDLEVGMVRSVQQLAVPSYYDPCYGCATNYWLNTKGKARIVIANPNSGPDTALDSNYVTMVSEMKAGGALVLGYVATTYGAKTAATVQAEIDKYYAWYGVSGIFFDEGSDSCTSVPYYQQQVAYVKTKDPNALTALNWGTDGRECYLSSSNAPDIVVNFEDSYSNYLSWSGPATWTANYPPSKFWQLVYAAPATQAALDNALSLSRSRRAGWVYITNDVLNNPWDTLPTLWSQEVAATANANFC